MVLSNKDNLSCFHLASTRWAGTLCYWNGLAPMAAGVSSRASTMRFSPRWTMWGSCRCGSPRGMLLRVRAADLFLAHKARCAGRHGRAFRKDDHRLIKPEKGPSTVAAFDSRKGWDERHRPAGSKKEAGRAVGLEAPCSHSISKCAAVQIWIFQLARIKSCRPCTSREMLCAPCRAGLAHPLVSSTLWPWPLSLHHRRMASKVLLA